jgi:NTP pyrophosphatase (non-canonical NTP hydrolase)
MGNELSRAKYRHEVIRTCGDLTRAWGKDGLLMGALGLTGEAGEVADLIKKHVFHDQPLDEEKLIKELGDVRWYLEYLCICLNQFVEEVEAINIQKLQKRYPNGFNSQDSKDKKDETCS